MQLASEPSANLPIRHTESICLNFELANDYVGLCQANLARALHQQVRRTSSFTSVVMTACRSQLQFADDDRAHLVSDGANHLAHGPRPCQSAAGIGVSRWQASGNLTSPRAYDAWAIA